MIILFLLKIFVISVANPFAAKPMQNDLYKNPVLNISKFKNSLINAIFRYVVGRSSK